MYSLLITSLLSILRPSSQLFFFTMGQGKNEGELSFSCICVFRDLKNNFIIACTLGDTGFFRLQGIKVLWSLQFVGYLRTLSLKFQKTTSKIEVVLALPCWLSQFSSVFLVAFWNFKLKVLKYPKNCRLHNTLIPWSLKNSVSPNLHICSAETGVFVRSAV